MSPYPSTSSPASLSSMETASKYPQQRSPPSRNDLIHLCIPLISTRRSYGAAGACSPELRHADTSRRVPFLWEEAPGVPKDGVRRRSRFRKDEDFFFFPPKPPPGRRRRHPVLAVSDGEDDGNDGEDDGKVSFPHSPALDSTECRGLHRPPSFIMNRFLRAANALAATTSTPAMPTAPNPPSTTTLHHCLQRELFKSRQPQTTTWSAATNAIKIQPPQRPLLPSRPRGFQVFFPWTLKQTPCGHKSPVMCQTPTRAGVEAFGGKSGKILFDHRTRVKETADDDDLSSKVFKSPGWGLPFLETSRLRVRGGGKPPNWKLPRLQKPSEPWLLRVLNNTNRT
ncbi:hypothetical protein KSP40_PGU004821 [Platanthera guangdongensis]|uniref:Uncharacterized protein n=1 Tax=Platanthera guangdongensis TaxID=2320717 RepID=A0ABR2LYT0_9ASPA